MLQSLKSRSDMEIYQSTMPPTRGGSSLDALLKRTEDELKNLKLGSVSYDDNCSVEVTLSGSDMSSFSAL